MPDKALWWPQQEALVIADPHLGKAAALRAARMPLPGGSTSEDLGRLSAMLDATGARRLIVLGDLLHAREGRAVRTLEVVSRWRERHCGLEMTLVRGNHDCRAGDPPAEWNIQCVDEPFKLGPFRFCHAPHEDGGDGYWIAGHLHPAVLLRGPARLRERLPCFLFGPAGAILPSFGSLTGAALVRPREGDRIFVTADGAVLEVK
ncbi:MAG: DEAD/DEAH box helicase [Armatimonadota bacterium]|nr:MAG: DEAD/DEAH box helicase [Armatimonadota bacterium]